VQLIQLVEESTILTAIKQVGTASAVTAPAEDASELDEAAMQQEGSHINQRSGQADYHVCFGMVRVLLVGV
jgi:hypothetical protein